MSVAENIKTKLAEGLNPLRIELVDESDRHIGHAGHDGQGESHFRLLVVAEAFTGLSRIERHRMVNALLADELANRIHALSIKALTPDEQG